MDNLYGGNDTTTDMEQFSTPLKKLSNNSLTDIKLTNPQPLKVPIEKINSLEEDNHVKDTQFQLHEPTGGFDITNSNAGLTPLSDVAFQLYQTKLTSDSHKGHAHQLSPFFLQSLRLPEKTPIYYRPPTSSEGTQYGIKSFLPPTFNKRNFGDNRENKMPITISGPQPVGSVASMANENDDDDIDGNENAANPTGEWFSPVVRDALQRQVRKEVEIKRIGWNLLYLLFFRLCVSIGNYILTLYEFRRLPFQSLGGYYPPIKQEHIEPGTIGFYTILAVRVVYGFFIFNCLVAAYRQTKGQDQCFDLPLTNKQRQLLGLKVDLALDHIPFNQEGSDDNAAELTLKQRRFELQHKDDYVLPKYNKSNIYSTQTYNPTFSADEKLHDGTDLTFSDVTVKNRLIRSSSLRLKPREEDATIRSNFSRNYNIDFNYSDDEDTVSLPTSRPVDTPFNPTNRRQDVFR